MIKSLNKAIEILELLKKILLVVVYYKFILLLGYLKVQPMGYFKHYCQKCIF